jgi:flavorubredoxin
VAVSTQLFNNRVIVNGNLGNKQYSMGNTQNEVVGDLDIEIKIDRSGAVRLNVFSHSADQFSNYLDNSQRNGVGVTYQTEFNSFGQFLRNIFSSKSRRQEAKRAEEQAVIDGGMTLIEIPKTRTVKQSE